MAEQSPLKQWFKRAVDVLQFRKSSMKVLIVQASPSKEQWKSSELWKYVAKQLWWETTTRALYDNPIPFLQGEFIQYNYGRIEYSALSDQDKKFADLQKKMVKERKETDAAVVCIPMWNFAEPGIMKTYTDFMIKMPDVLKVDQNGYHGQLWNLKAVAICIATWGTWYEDGPMQGFEFISSYYEKLYTFLWAKTVKTFFIQGTGQKSVDADKMMKQVQKQVDEWTKTLQIEKAVKESENKGENKNSENNSSEDKESDQESENKPSKSDSSSKSSDAKKQDSKKQDSKKHDSDSSSSSDKKKITIDPKSDGKIVIEIKE